MTKEVNSPSGRAAFKAALQISEIDISNSGGLLKANNLADVASVSSARGNLSLVPGTDILPMSGGILTGALTLNANPVNPLHATTKQYADAIGTTAQQYADTLQTSMQQYVDSMQQGLDGKLSVLAATTAALPTNTRAVNVLTASANGALTIDGISITLNARVLVKNEASAVNNGIYYLSQVGNGGTPWKLTRTTDFDNWSEVAGAYTFVESGTVNGGSGWVSIASPTGTINVNNIPWSIFSRAADYTASGGIALSVLDFALAINTLTEDVSPDAANDFLLVYDTSASAHKKVKITNFGLLSKAGGVMTGGLTTVASAAGGAGLNLPHGTAPTSPVNGDLWSTSGGLFTRINGVTKQIDAAAVNVLTIGSLSRSSNYSMQLSDAGTTIVCNNAITVTPLSPGTAGNGFVVGIKNAGTAVVTVSSSGGLPAMSVYPGEEFLMRSNSSAWSTIGREASLKIASIAVVNGANNVKLLFTDPEILNYEFFGVVSLQTSTRPLLSLDTIGGTPANNVTWTSTNNIAGTVSGRSGSYISYFDPLNVDLSSQYFIAGTVNNKMGRGGYGASLFRATITSVANRAEIYGTDGNTEVLAVTISPNSSLMGGGNFEVHGNRSRA